jgi:hypothetical protein
MLSKGYSGMTGLSQTEVSLRENVYDSLEIQARVT